MALSGETLSNGASPAVWRWQRFGDADTRDRLCRRFFSWGDKLVGSFVRWVDAFLRRRQGIIEFSQDEQCILRVSLRHPRSDESFPSGIHVGPEDWIGEFHLWNEHMAPIPAGGPDMMWAAKTRRGLHRSLVRLARHAQTDPRFAHVKLFCGETAFAENKSIEQTRWMASCLGFQVTEHRKRWGFFSWWARLGEAIYLWGMVRTFNRGALRGRRLLKPTWFQFWLTRETLLSRYCPAEHDLSRAA